MNGEVNEEVPVILADDSFMAAVDRAEKKIDFMKRVKQIVFKMTNSNDWVDQNGNPYLQVSGAEKVAGTFGISWRIDEPQLKTEEDGHYSYVYKGYFSLGNRSIEFEGSRGTKDPFFSKSHGEDKPLTEIDRNDVRKAALTNTIGNGVTRILGIRNLTWEELEAAGIKKGKVGSRVEYSKKEMSKDVKSQRDKIGSMLMEMAGDDKEEAKKLLEKYTTFVGTDNKTVKGKSSIGDLSVKQIPVTYGKVKEEYEKWRGGAEDVGDEVPLDFDK